MRPIAFILGKFLVVLGIAVLVALALAVPMAFVAQAGTVLTILQFASLGLFVAFAALLIGDNLADRIGRKKRRLAIPVSASIPSWTPVRYNRRHVRRTTNDQTWALGRALESALRTPTNGKFRKLLRALDDVETSGRQRT